MAYDGTVLKAVIEELKNNLINSKVEKIYQPSKEELIFNFRGNKGRYKLLISAASNSPRVYFTDVSYENPTIPPAFCMLLRKHLENSRVLDIKQYKMDRIFKIDFLSKSELGDLINKSLVVEIMGKHSNIILIETDTNNIYDSIKRVNSFTSRIREILPGLTYSASLISTKYNPLDPEIFEEAINNFDKNKTLKNNLINTFTGISPLISREVTYRANLDDDRIFSSLNDEEYILFIQALKSLINQLKNNEFSPILIKSDAKIIEFSSLDLQMFPQAEKISYDSISALLDDYYSHKEKSQALNEKSNSLKRIVKNHLDRTVKKLEKQSEELNEAIDREKFKIYGDLISSNSYKIEKGIKSIELENFYDNMKIISIPLDEKLSAQQNANKYYKKYSKLKNAVGILNNEIDVNKNKVNYLNSVLLNIELSDSISDLEDIRDELVDMGYLKKQGRNKRQKNKKVTFLEYNSSEGYKIYAGKNNRQNEELTLKFARKSDMWFHVKDAPGSHVILKEDGRDFSMKSIKEAAIIAAFNSSLKNSNNIEVDYTLKKNVKRHPAKMPGLVSYINYETIVISDKDLLNLQSNKEVVN
ncbi:Rqc2 family fibronectin-binding protein [Anaerosphaera multitolerans]|uniref:Rqc2 homolog RqcH n=1 Tax=Anaerosphaera multitolerans TaxID=2487351 RepID=A0A437S8G9_9FIRM|nr:NFACT RNA binding domain-containing protein [Anaerosphaera multitolerans]RVU55204.1 fibronectin/fibrinogen-binding protein [Anaerosphaera multitolerans]